MREGGGGGGVTAGDMTQCFIMRWRTVREAARGGSWVTEGWWRCRGRRSRPSLRLPPPFSSSSRHTAVYCFFTPSLLFLMLLLFLLRLCWSRTETNNNTTDKYVCYQLIYYSVCPWSMTVISVFIYIYLYFYVCDEKSELQWKKPKSPCTVNSSTLKQHLSLMNKTDKPTFSAAGSLCGITNWCHSDKRWILVWRR